MTMTLIDIIGLCAGCLTSIAFLPQVIQVWKQRSAKDISLSMYLIFVVGVCFWLVYGILSHAMPVIIANVVTLVLAGFVLLMKIRFG
jgi:MtN3 and saliva related transmembrane protein